MHKYEIEYIALAAAGLQLVFLAVCRPVLISPVQLDKHQTDTTLLSLLVPENFAWIVSSFDV